MKISQKASELLSGTDRQTDRQPDGQCDNYRAFANFVWQGPNDR